MRFRTEPLGKHTPYDERWLKYYEYLKKNKFEKVLITDISDVWFKKNPFELLSPKFRLFIGSEESINCENKWMKSHYLKVFGKEFKFLQSKQVLNAGIVGGTYNEVLKLLSKMRKEILKINVKGVLYDMVVLNKIVYSKYNKGEIYTARKLHSPYKKYATRGDYCIFHK